MIRRPPRSPLFPYTPLSRSRRGYRSRDCLLARGVPHGGAEGARAGDRRPDGREPLQGHGAQRTARSEEHTSELQSPCNLVCRLLLEKKKRKTRTTQRK